MANIPYPSAVYIKNDAELARCVAQLSKEPSLGVDTESNSLHAYRERVCLIQLSSRTADYIVDPLTIGDLYAIAPLFANPAIQKVFHAAEYDIMCLKRDYGFEFANLFDTMIAARICGHKSIGLNALVEHYAGVQIDKSHQLDDWGKRPLEAESLTYAQADTHHLLLLRDVLLMELNEHGRLAEALEKFIDLQDLPPSQSNDFDPDGYWKLGIPNQLTRRQMAVLREVFLLREKLAEQKDLPPFKVLSNKALVAIAQLTPRTMSALIETPEVGSTNARRHGRRLLAAIECGLKAPLPKQPAKQRPDTAVMVRYAALHAWRKDRAMQRGVDSDVILPKHMLWVLARRAPTSMEQLEAINGLGPWRLENYGAEILNVLQEGYPQNP